MCYLVFKLCYLVKIDLIFIFCIIILLLQGGFMNFYNIFFDTIENFFDFLIIDLFIKNHGYKSYYKHILKPIFLTFRIFYAIITFPNWFVYILNIIILAYILVSCNGALIKRLITAIKYFMYDYISTFIYYCMHYFLEIYYKLLQINFTHIIIRLLVLSFLISLPVYILILKKSNH